ncbi:AsmA family protein [Pedobacter sp. MW01-1-1]|uniref:AsmA family protein n=1 Tax=Pedobacter sp. MW01-1-1 TaxID=3383027 RepID=UPI003FEF4A74
MTRWLKISLKILGGFILLFLLICAASTIYIKTHKKAILSAIMEQLNKNINGSLTVSDMSPRLFKGFPNVSVSLKEVELNDSLYAQHQHHLLTAKDIDVSLALIPLFSGGVVINRIGINHANVYLFTDSSGYSNTSVFRKKTSANLVDSTKKSNQLEVKKIDFEEVSLVIDNQKRNKLFHFDVHALTGKIKYPDSGLTGVLKIDAQIKSFAFNTKKGSFLKDKSLKGTLDFHLNKMTEEVIILPKPLKINETPYVIGANIHLAKGKGGFALNIHVKDVLYKDVASLLSPNISSKLLKFQIEKPVVINGTIVDDGSGKYRDPLINVAIAVRNNVVKVPPGTLTDCNFDGTFTNQDTVGGMIGDENSSIKFFKLRANYFNAPLQIDTFLVNNLSQPIATGYVKSDFPLTNLNESMSTNHFEFKKGTASVRLYCKADINNFSFTKPVISGKIRIANADILYVPRNLHLVRSALDIDFDQNDLSIKNGRFELGKSILNLNCSIKNFTNLYYTAPEKIMAEVSMSSPQLHLTEFLPFLGPRKQHKKGKPSSPPTPASKQLSNVLEVSNMNIKLQVKKAIYKKFVAYNFYTDVSLRGRGIYFNSIHLQHAGGSLAVNGHIFQEAKFNSFKLLANVNHVNIKDFFYAFDNFNQDGLTYKNLLGYLSSKVHVNGKISQTGSILPRSMYGIVSFNLNKAALVNFEPLEKVGKFAFANRNFSNVTIDKLDGVLHIQGDKIAIAPMQINSSVLNFDVRGIYGLNAGTNLMMDIPLRNPKKDEKLSEDDKQKRRMKGIVLHLKAIEEKGSLKIKWNKDHD